MRALHSRDNSSDHSKNCWRRTRQVLEGFEPREVTPEQSTTRWPLAGYRILDVGCGAGLLSESLARLGATVVGLDATGPNVAAAKEHRATDPELSRLADSRLTYLHDTVEALAGDPAHAGQVIFGLNKAHLRTWHV